MLSLTLCHGVGCVVSKGRGGETRPNTPTHVPVLRPEGDVSLKMGDNHGGESPGRFANMEEHAGSHLQTSRSRSQGNPQGSWCLEMAGAPSTPCSLALSGKHPLRNPGWLVKGVTQSAGHPPEQGDLPALAVAGGRQPCFSHPRLGFSRALLSSGPSCETPGSPAQRQDLPSRLCKLPPAGAQDLCSQSPPTSTPCLLGLKPSRLYPSQLPPLLFARAARCQLGPSSVALGSRRMSMKERIVATKSQHEPRAPGSAMGKDIERFAMTLLGGGCQIVGVFRKGLPHFTSTFPNCKGVKC